MELHAFIVSVHNTEATRMAVLVMLRCRVIQNTIKQLYLYLKISKASIFSLFSFWRNIKTNNSTGLTAYILYRFLSLHLTQQLQVSKLVGVHRAARHLIWGKMKITVKVYIFYDNLNGTYNVLDIFLIVT